MSCNKVSCTTDSDAEQSFKKILSHEGSFDKDSPNCKGCNYNVMTKWENGETNAEPLSIIRKDVPAALVRHTGSSTFVRPEPSRMQMSRCQTCHKLSYGLHYSYGCYALCMHVMSLITLPQCLPAMLHICKNLTGQAPDVSPLLSFQ